MIRTTKKDIVNEIREGRYIDITDETIANYCIYKCRDIAFASGKYGCSGLVFGDCEGNLYATASRSIIDKYF